MEYSIQQPLQEAKALMRRVRKGAWNKKKWYASHSSGDQGFVSFEDLFCLDKALGSWLGNINSVLAKPSIECTYPKNRTAILRKYMALLRTDSQLPDNDALNIPKWRLKQ